MHLNRHTIINVSLAFLALGFSVLASNHALAQGCTPVSGTTVTITTSCSDLVISGNANVNINSGVIINGGKNAVATGNTTNATITNNGTIIVTKVSGLSNGNGFITNLINNGSISAGKDGGLKNDIGGTITSITNTGIISAVRSVGLNNKGTIGTITNSGTISAGTDFGLFNDGIIGTIINSGTISAGNDFGISNIGTITTLTNTGTISALGNNIGILNTGTITTLNNSQGASGSALTYDGTLPTNYNIIVISTSDFGKIVFSNVSGAINFEIDSSSTLADVDTTYSTVLSGLSSSDIASGTSWNF
jgi:hypothetical protein